MMQLVSIHKPLSLLYSSKWRKKSTTFSFVAIVHEAWKAKLDIYNNGHVIAPGGGRWGWGEGHNFIYSKLRVASGTLMF